MKSRLALLAICSLAAVGLPSACSRKPAATASVELRVGAGVEPRDLDPQTNVGAPEGVIISALFEGLVSLADNGTDLIPGVAERWDVSADGLRYTFHLRQNAAWSNGDPVAANDFVGSWQRLLDPAVAAELAYLAHDISGAEAFHGGKTTDFSTVGVRATDAHTLEVKLHRPSPYFLLLLARYPFLPVHLPSVTAAGGLHRLGADWTRPGQLISNGAFQLQAWKPHSELVVVKNPGYWDASRVQLASIRFLPIERAETEEAAFRSGQLEITRTLRPTRMETWQRERPAALRTAPRLGQAYLEFNARRGPTADAKIRRALALSIDRTRLAQAVVRNHQAPAATLLRASDAPTLTERDAFDPDTARQLLSDAGFPGGKGLPALRFLYNTNELNRDVAEALQEMWRRELGISVTLVNQEWKVFLDSRNQGDFDIVRSAWQPFTPDPFDSLAHFRSDSQENHSGWANPDYDRLATTVLATSNIADRTRICRELDALLRREAPVTPLYYLWQSYLASERLVGWSDNELGFHLWKNAGLAP